MAWNEEGGVCTQKMIAATAVLVMVLAAGAVLFETSSNVDGSTTYIQGDTNLVKVGGTLTYQIMFFESDDFETLSISYSAVLKDSNGSNQSGAVSPSTGTMTNGVESTLTITAPKTAGNYTLSVTFTEVKDGGASVKTERTQSVNVVEPVVLSANLMNNSKVGFTDYVVYFKVNGNLIKESRTLVSVAANQTTTVTYEWVTDSLPTGTYKFQVVAGDENIGSSQTSFTGGEGTFYVGHADFGLIGILLAILLVVLIIVIVYIYRKPVKNYGKPKSRR